MNNHLERSTVPYADVHRSGDMKIEYLRECIILAETLSFSQTAELSYTTQPAVSRHLSQVEQELGIHLFERSTHGVSITEAGEVAIAGFRTTIEAYERARDAALRAAHGINGSLIVSSPYYWTEKYTEPILRSLAKTLPGCSVQLISCQPIEGFEQMVSGESDIALSMAMNTLPDNIDCASFAQEPLAAVMRSDNPLATREAIRIDELVFDTFVALDRKRYSVFDTAFATTLLDKVSASRRIVEADQIEMVALTVQQTGGVSILPYEVRRMNRSYIRTVRIEDTGAEFELCHFWRKDNENPLLRPFLAAADMITID